MIRLIKEAYTVSCNYEINATVAFTLMLFASRTKKMLNRVLIIIILTIIPLTKVMANEINSSDYVLYSKIIYDYLKENSYKKGHKVFIMKSTEFKNAYEDFMHDPYKIPCLSCNNFSQINKTTSADSVFVNLWVKLDSINKHPVELDNKFKIRKYEPIMVDSTLWNIYSKENIFDWKSLYKENPKTVGVITLSKIAYSSNGKYAILYIAYQYEGLGAVAKILFIDIEQGYKIVKDEIMWQN